MSNQSTHTQAYSCDICIFGGGIAGLWLLNRLREEGFNAILLEAHSIGGEQSMASQGIIHGGLKYALAGTLNNEAEAIAAMPARWRACLENSSDAETDLSSVPIISQTQYMWSPSRVSGGVTTFFASRLLRGRIEKLNRKDYPQALNSPAFKGKAYSMNDLVLDVPALMQFFYEKNKAAIFAINDESYRFAEQGNGTRISFDHFTIDAQKLVLCAGRGNEALCQLAGIDEPMQLRPLRMVMMETSSDIAFYGHCLGAGNKPRLTITSHKKQNGHWVWYLGGDVAENPDEPADITLANARNEIEKLFPWLDFNEQQFSCYEVDRAEPKQAALVKPDAAYVNWHGNIAVAWPTKLTLAPDLSDKIFSELGDLKKDNAAPAALPLSPAPLALSPWEQDA